ncbi:MAG: FadR/GntR family transcriptional regulator [Steroidobacteraceae bacterium]
MSLSAPTRSATLSVQVAGQLESLIASGQWPVGTRIPAESALVSSLGVSRNTVREALRCLAHIGLLEARVGDGTYVKAFSELEAPFVRRARRAGASDGIELRAMLERGAARLAAQRRTPDDIAKLRQLLQRQRAAGLANDAAAYAEADSALHQAVVGCAGNQLLTDVYEYLGGALKLTVSPEMWDRALAVREVSLHAELIEAIAAGDEAEAERAATGLIEALRAALLAPECVGRAPAGSDW